MLSVKSKPIKFITQQTGNIIIVTNHQLILSSLFNISQAYHFKILSQSPQIVSYSSQKSQILLYNHNSIQIFQIGWKSMIKLKTYITMYEEQALSIHFYNQRWNVYGNFRQYNLKDVHFHNIVKFSQGIASCFHGPKQFVLTHKKLAYYDHYKQHLQPIKWQKITQYTNKLSKQTIIMMIQHQKEQTYIILMNNICLLMKNHEIVNILGHSHQISLDNGYILYEDYGEETILYGIKQDKFQKVVELDNMEEQFKTCIIIEGTIYLIYHSFQIIYLKKHRFQQTKNLVIQEQSSQKLQIFKQCSHDQLPSKKQLIQVNQKSSQASRINICQKQCKQAAINKMQEQFEYCESQEQKFNQEINEVIDEAISVELYSSQDALNQNSIQDNAQNNEILEDIKRNNQQQISFKQNSRVEIDYQNKDIAFQLPQYASNANLISQHSSTPSSDTITPVFNVFDNKINNNWQNFQQKWNYMEIEQVLEEQQFIDGQSEIKIGVQKSQILNFQPQINIMKKSSVNQYKTLIKNLKECYKRQPHLFQEKLKDNFEILLQQKDSKLFFADYVKLTNQDLTKDRLLRLFNNIQNTNQSRALMTYSLGQFKLNQVPANCLSIPKQIINIFTILYNTVYIEDLSNPSIHLYQYLLQNYLSHDYSTQSIDIQGENIKLKYPRNLLNILLYLNQLYNLPLDHVLKVYIQSMLKHSKHGPIRSMIEDKITSICQVRSNIYEECAQEITKDIIENLPQDYQKVLQLLQFMTSQKAKVYSEIVNFMDYCLTASIKYRTELLLALNQHKNGIQFIRDIICQNLPLSLAKIKLKYIFRLVYKIQFLAPLKTYTNDHYLLSKQLAQILMEAQFYQQAFLTLQPFSTILDRYYLASLLIKYYKGKLLNRLINKYQNQQQYFKSIFSVIILSNNQIKGDKLPQQIDQKNRSITWQNFKQYCTKFNKYYSQQLCYIFYEQLKFGKKLIQLNILSIEDYKQIQKQLGVNKKSSEFDIFGSNILQRNQQKLDIPIQVLHSSKNTRYMQEMLESFRQKKSNPNIHRFNSDKGAQSQKNQSSENSHDYLCKSYIKNENYNDQTLLHIKLQVDKEVIIQNLSKIYYESPIQKFLNALSMIDKQRIGLINIQMIKILISADLSYNFQKIIPFQYFLKNQENFQSIIFKNIRQEIDLQNFWVLYLLGQILLKKGIEIIKIMIHKLINYEKDEDWSCLLQEILNNKQIPQIQRSQLARQAEQKGLDRIKQTLMIK